MPGFAGLFDHVKSLLVIQPSQTPVLLAVRECISLHGGWSLYANQVQAMGEGFADGVNQC